MSLIEVKGLSKVFRTRDGAELAVLRDIDLAIEQGELVVLLGPSGCGKSTLLRIIAGLDTPTAGVAIVAGTPVADASQDRGMVFQSYTSFPWLSVRQNIEFGLARAGQTRAARDPVVDRLLDLVGLRGFQNAHPKHLSGGMQQRLAIARTLAMDPRVLLMDEPFGALDAQTRQGLQEELISIQRSTKKTVIFVTHDIDEALLLGSRIVVMSARPGRIIHDEVRPSQRIQSREYFFTDDFVAAKRKYARLLENRVFNLTIREWRGYAPLQYATTEEFVPPQIRVQSVPAPTRPGVNPDWSDAIVLPLPDALRLVSSESAKIVLSMLAPAGLGSSIVVVRSQAVKTPADLVHARLAISPGSLEHLVLTLVFDAHGLDLAGIKPGAPNVVVGEPQTHADLLAAGHVDVAVLQEPQISALFESAGDEGFGFFEHQVDPALLQHVCCVRQSALLDKRDLALSCLRFILEANGLFVQAESEALAILEQRAAVRQTGWKAAEHAYNLFENLSYYDLEENTHLYLEGKLTSTLRDLAGVMSRAGLLPTPITDAAIMSGVDRHFVESLVAESGGAPIA